VSAKLYHQLISSWPRIPEATQRQLASSEKTARQLAKNAHLSPAAWDILWKQATAQPSYAYDDMYLNLLPILGRKLTPSQCDTALNFRWGPQWDHDEEEVLTAFLMENKLNPAQRRRLLGKQVLSFWSVVLLIEDYHDDVEFMQNLRHECSDDLATRIVAVLPREAVSDEDAAQVVACTQFAYVDDANNEYLRSVLRWNIIRVLHDRPGVAKRVLQLTSNPAVREIATNYPAYPTGALKGSRVPRRKQVPDPEVVAVALELGDSTNAWGVFIDLAQRATPDSSLGDVLCATKALALSKPDYSHP
jgi:hypothetical protein